MSSRAPQDEQRTPQGPPRLLFKVFNPIFLALLRSPFHRLVSDQFMLLTVTGVKSGRRYTFPVGYARSGGTLYTGTEGHWARNLNDGARVDFTLNGVHRLGTAEVIDDVEGMTEAYRIICVASH